MGNASPSKHPGMGSIRYAGGTAFRVWAPHADQVFVTGNFNDWSKNAHPLAPEASGYWSADIAGATPGDQYKYLIINAETELFRIDPYAQELVCSACNSIIHDAQFDWGAQRFEPPPRSHMVIYEMHIGTFNYTGGEKPGDFSTAMSKLDYLKELGVNAIEVMPAMEFKGSFSWGYNPALIFAIESDYGGPRAFKEFVKAAHARGIAVILDVVYNHLGPGDLDLWQFDGWSENNKGGIYFYNDARSQTPWGDTRPDYGRAEVRQYIRDNAMMWLEEFRVDGLRWDATAFIRNVQGKDNDPSNDIPEGWSLMQWVNDETKRHQPGKMCIAEDIRNNLSLTQPTTDGGAGFDAQWDGLFVRHVRQALACPKDEVVDMEAVRAAIEARYDTDAFARVIYTESHDEVANGKSRVPEEISADDPGSWIAKKLSTLGAALVFTSPGIPMIFQGQEFLEDDWFHDKDPIDWAKKDRYAGILQLYRDLIRLRRNEAGQTAGLSGQHVTVHHVNNEAKVLAFHRYAKAEPGDSVIVVVNLKNHPCQDYPIGFPREGLWKVRFNSDSSQYDAGFSNQGGQDVIAQPGENDGMPCTGQISAGPYTVLILSQDGQPQ